MAQILIVDDEPETIRLLARIISLLQHDPLEASSGEQALSFLQLGMPDLILLDLMMPEMDGYEVMRQIRARPEGRNVPIVVVTASPEVDVEERVREAGGNAVYFKPIGMAMLTEAINNHIHTGDTAPLAA